MKRFLEKILPFGLLPGAIIGAGVFSLPYTVNKGGLLVGVFYILLATFIYIYINTFYADVILMTEGEHRFVGYMKKYFGASFSWLGVIMAILQMFLVLTIYLVLSASFIKLLFPVLPDVVASFIFWTLGSIAIFLSMKKLAFSEFLITGGIIGIIAVVFGFGASELCKVLETPLISKGVFLFAPLPIILFSFGGRVAVPSLVKLFKDNPKKLKRAIRIGVAIPALVYLLFIVGILGLSNEVSEDAVGGIVGSVPNIVLVLIGIFGILSLWSSYILIGANIRNNLKYDLNFSKISQILIVSTVPFILYLLGLNNFLFLVGLTGGLFMSLEGIFIINFWLRAREEHQSFLIKKLPVFKIILFLLVFLGALTGVLMGV